MADTKPAPEAAAAPAPGHILVVDDDAALRQMLTEYLNGHDLRVSAVANGTAMRSVMAEEAVDLVVLDLKLPGEDGMALARELRAQGTVPIVLLTGRNEEADRVMGLELGADDYVTKPFSPRELLARMRAVLRRTRSQPAAPADESRRAYRFEGWELNLRTRRLHAPDGRKLELTNGEFSLLAALCAAPQRVLSRDQLLGLSRLHAAEVYDRSIDVQVLRLRRRMEADPAQPTLIVTERGIGYRFTPHVSSVY
jgi:two-component system, OmpR family, response regulator